MNGCERKTQIEKKFGRMIKSSEYMFTFFALTFSCVQWIWLLFVFLGIYCLVLQIRTASLHFLEKHKALPLTFSPPSVLPQLFENMEKFGA